MNHCRLTNVYAP